MPTGPRSFEYIETLRSKLASDKEIVWGEGGTVSCGANNHPVGQMFVGILWGVDAFLESAVAGVTRVHLHGVPYNVYTPLFKLPKGVEIRPMYYSMLFVTKMIGGANSVIFKPFYTTSKPQLFKVWGIYDTFTKEVRIVMFYVT